MNPYELAREAFNSYCSLDEPALPPSRFSALQVKLARWQTKMFGAQPASTNVIGINEEIGELTEAVLGLACASGRVNHAVLKNMQGIRGFDNKEKCREAISDAVADITIFIIQLCTTQRIDFETILEKTAEYVMTRKEATPPA